MCLFVSQFDFFLIATKGDDECITNDILAQLKYFRNLEF